MIKIDPITRIMAAVPIPQSSLALLATHAVNGVKMKIMTRPTGHRCLSLIAFFSGLGLTRKKRAPFNARFSLAKFSACLSNLLVNRIQRLLIDT